MEQTPRRWYLPHRSCETGLACLIGMVLSSIVAVIGFGKLHDETASRQP